MRVLGVDPGTRYTGWVFTDDTEATTPRIVASDTMIRPRRSTDLNAWMAEVVTTVIAVAFKHQAQLVAVEDFTHQGWRGRRITTAPEMGKLLGQLQAHLEGNRLPFVLVNAFDSKANMSLLASRFRTTHEFSAWCAAVYGARLWRRQQREAEEREGVSMTDQKTLPGMEMLGGRTPEEHALTITHASQLDGDDRLRIGQEVEVRVTARVVGVAFKERRRAKRDGGGTYLVRQTILAAGKGVLD